MTGRHGPTLTFPFPSLPLHKPLHSTHPHDLSTPTQHPPPTLPGQTHTTTKMSTTLSYAHAKTILSEVEKERIVCTYLNSTEPNAVSNPKENSPLPKQSAATKP
jgi:hypothetical protein